MTVALALPGGAILLWEGLRGRPSATPWLTSGVVVVTYNALPWIERCLESVRGVRDDRRRPRLDRRHGRPRARALPGGQADRAGEPRPRPRAGTRAWRPTTGRYVLILNADAWLDGRPLERLVAFADAHPEAAVVGPRLRNPDGTLQRSVRGFPTLWRLATEYLFLRKLAPRSRR